MKITLFQFVLFFVFLNVAMANKMKSSPRVLVDKEVTDAQTIIIIKGRVMDEKGESLAGATVLVRNTAQQITTDSNGNYTLSAKIGYVLQFSHVGLKTKNIKVNSRTLKVKPKGDILNVVLDVVLVGIG